MRRLQLAASAGQRMHVAHGSLFVSMHGKWNTSHRHGGYHLIKLSANTVFPQSYWRVDSQLNALRPIVGNRQAFLVEIFLWCKLWAHEILWRLKNPKVVALLMTALVSTVTFAIIYRFNIVHLSRGSGTENVSFNLGDEIGLMLAGLTTLSAVWGFGAIFTESIIPGSDTIGERLSLGSGDPFERFRKHFYQTMEQVRRPVIVIVDDLDRCRPAVIVDLIRGIQTLLRSSRVVFAILGEPRLDRASI